MYVATINIPGYLPMDDEPPTFGAAREAWDWLADERKRSEDDAADENTSGYSATVNIMEQFAQGNWDPGLASIDEITGEGTVYGDRPDLDSEHDQGLAYNVTIVEG